MKNDVCVWIPLKRIVLSRHVQHKVKFWKIVYQQSPPLRFTVIFQTSQEIIYLFEATKAEFASICVHTKKKALKIKKKVKTLKIKKR